MTTLRVPVRITASVGTTSTGFAAAAPKATVANMPGFRTPPGFASTMRARIVRVAAFTSGSSALTLPLNARSG